MQELPHYEIWYAADFQNDTVTLLQQRFCILNVNNCQNASDATT